MVALACIDSYCILTNSMYTQDHFYMYYYVAIELDSYVATDLATD